MLCFFNLFLKHLTVEKIDMQLDIRDTLRKFEIAPTLPFKKSPLGYWKSRSSETERSWVAEMS
jgi:hypothetical protein